MRSAWLKLVNRLSRRADPRAPRRRRAPKLRPIVTAPAAPADAATAGVLAAAERLARPPRPWQRRPWAWGIAIALHIAVILFIIWFVRLTPPKDEETAPGIAVVFDNGGQPQTAAPPAPLPGMQPATQAPPPPPPPQQQADTQPEVNLGMPQMALPELPPLSQAPPAPPAPSHLTTRPTRPQPPQRYVMMNGMSYGHASAAPSHSLMPQALDTSPPESNAEAVNAPELTIKGKIGADWKAELSRWVNEHKYYPDAAAAQGQEGNVSIEFTVDRNGNVTGLRMLDGSGSVFLDQAWLGLFANNTLPPFPPGTQSDHLTIDATMHFVLIR
jgi:protein TonB